MSHLRSRSHLSRETNSVCSGSLAYIQKISTEKRRTLRRDRGAPIVMKQTAPRTIVVLPRARIRVCVDNNVLAYLHYIILMVLF